MDIERRVFLAGTVAAAIAAATAPARATAPDLKLVQVTEGVFAFHGEPELMSARNHGAVCNLGVVVGRDTVAVIDSGGTLFEARAMVDAIRAVTDRPIAYLINTHMHPDHVFGNAVFRDLGATIIGHRNLPQALMSRADTYLRTFTRELGAEMMAGVEIVPPTEFVDGTRELDLGDRKLLLTAWKPAHTDNDLTILDGTSQTLFTGDLVFRDHIPTLDGSVLGWVKQLDLLAAIPAKACVPGHGAVSQTWPMAIDDERRYLTTLVSDMRAAVKAGTPLATAVTTAAASERDKWKLFDEFNERNAAATFAELEWE